MCIPKRNREVQQVLPQRPGHHYTKSDVPTASLAFTRQGQLLVSTQSGNLAWPRTRQSHGPFYRNFSCSTLASELCTRLAAGPAARCGQAGRLLFRGVPGRHGAERQAGPSCHPAVTPLSPRAADVHQPQQMHAAGCARSHRHTRVYLTHRHSWTAGLCNTKPR